MADAHPVTVETLKQILNAFNRHDLDATMEFFESPADLPGFQTSTTEKTAVGFARKEACPNGAYWDD